MWVTIGKYLVKGALWAVEHPEVLQQIIADVQAIKAAKDAAKAKP